MSNLSECGDGFIDNDYSHPAESPFLGRDAIVGIGACADAETPSGTNELDIIDTNGGTHDNNQ